MTCPHCRTLSCYICRKIINGYDHFHQNVSSFSFTLFVLRFLRLRPPSYVTIFSSFLVHFIRVRSLGPVREFDGLQIVVAFVSSPHEHRIIGGITFTFNCRITVASSSVSSFRLNVIAFSFGPVLVDLPTRISSPFLSSFNFPILEFRRTLSFTSVLLLRLFFFLRFFSGVFELYANGFSHCSADRILANPVARLRTTSVPFGTSASTNDTTKR